MAQESVYQRFEQRGIPDESDSSVCGTLISELLLVVVDPRIKLTGSARGG